MATNKNATIRYQALDKCFRNIGKRYAITDLIEACNVALSDYNSSSQGVKRRQIYEDINFMKSEQGYAIDLEVTKEGRTAFYRYANPNFSINNQPINETEALQLKEALLTLNRIKGLPQFGWVEELTLKLEKDFNLHNSPREIIGFENNPYLKGLEFLTDLFNAILYQKVITIGYKSFKNTDVEEIKMHPQFLKQYQNRWYVLGTHSKHKPVTTLSIDRISYIKENQEKYIESDIDFNERYEDIVGINRGEENNTKVITFFADYSLASYITTSPMHGSQKHISNDENGLTFTLEVIPNFELEQQILSYGETLKVISPDDFAEKIKNRIQKSLANY